MNFKACTVCLPMSKNVIKEINELPIRPNTHSSAKLLDTFIGKAKREINKSETAKLIKSHEPS